MTWNPLRDQHRRRLLRAEMSRLAHRMAEEDVTVLGEQLTELHWDTLTTDLRGEIAGDYQAALDAYEKAKQVVHAPGALDDVEVHSVLDDGRYHLACVLARRDGRDVPERLPSCFFNPQHGPSHTEVPFTPPGGVERRVPVCLADFNRLEQRVMPLVRTVMVGGNVVPYYAVDDALQGRAGKVDARAAIDMVMTYRAMDKFATYDPMLNPRRKRDLE